MRDGAYGKGRIEIDDHGIGGPDMRTLIGLAVATAALSMAACSATAAENSSRTTPPQSEQSQVASVAGVAAAKYQVTAEGSLIRQFSLPTLAEFVRDPYVSNVIVGTVEASRTIVLQPDNSVETVLTVAVEDSKVSTAKMVTAREYGGVVSVEEVRDDFESKIGRKLAKKELSEKVEYHSEGVPRAQVGDRVLLAVADDGSGLADYTVLTRLESAASTATRSAEVSFEWPGEPPNPAWRGVTPADLY